MNNQEKFMTRLKVNRSNSQMISSYSFRFFSDILFSSLISFAFCLVVFFVCVFFWNLKYIFWCTTDYAGGWVIKIFSHDRFPETRLFFFFSFGPRYRLIYIWINMWRVKKRFFLLISTRSKFPSENRFRKPWLNVGLD